MVLVVFFVKPAGRNYRKFCSLKVFLEDVNCYEILFRLSKSILLGALESHAYGTPD